MPIKKILIYSYVIIIIKIYNLFNNIERTGKRPCTARSRFSCPKMFHPRIFANPLGSPLKEPGGYFNFVY